MTDDAAPAIEVPPEPTLTPTPTPPDPLDTPVPPVETTPRLIGASFELLSRSSDEMRRA